MSQVVRLDSLACKQYALTRSNPFAVMLFFSARSAINVRWIPAELRFGNAEVLCKFVSGARRPGVTYLRPAYRRIGSLARKVSEEAVQCKGLPLIGVFFPLEHLSAENEHSKPFVYPLLTVCHCLLFLPKNRKFLLLD